MSKLCCIPFTLALEKLLGRSQQILDFQMVVSLMLVFSGMVLVTVHDISVHPLGIFWAFCSVACTSMAQVQFAPLRSVVNLDAPQLLFFTSPLLTIGAFASIPLFEDLPDLLATSLRYELVRDVIGSCIVSFGLNLSNIYVLSHSTPLTYMILGNMKTILVFVTGILLFDQWPSLRTFVGIVLTVSGAILYGYIKYQHTLKTTHQHQHQHQKQHQQQLQSMPSKVFDEDPVSVSVANSSKVGYISQVAISTGTVSDKV